MFRYNKFFYVKPFVLKVVNNLASENKFISNGYPLFSDIHHTDDRMAYNEVISKGLHCRCLKNKLNFKTISQQAEADFNKISGPRNKNYPGLISMRQGFQKCIA